MANRTFTYTIFISGPASRILHAITNADASGRYWGHHNVSTWLPGEKWEHVRMDGSAADVSGLVLEKSETTLVFTWVNRGADLATATMVSFEVKEHGAISRLVLKHENLPQEEFEAFANAWAAVLSNLKTFLETGEPMPVEPWKVPL